MQQEVLSSYPRSNRMELQFGASWAELNQFLESVTSTMNIERKYSAYEYYYQKVMHVCMLGQDEALLVEMEDYLKQYFQSYFKGINSLNEPLECYNQFFSFMINFRRVLGILGEIFSYFEYTNLINGKYRSFEGLMLSIVKITFNSYMPMVERVFQHFIAEINQFRHASDASLPGNQKLDALKQFFIEIGCFENSFCQYYISASEVHYQQFYGELTQSFSISEFLGRSFAAYNFEIALGERFLKDDLLYSVISRFNKQVLLKQLDLFQSDFSLLEQGKLEDLTLLFWYFQAINDLTSFKKLIYMYVHTKGKTLVSKDLTAQTIEDLIDLNNSLGRFIREAWSNDFSIQESVNAAFEETISSRVNQLSELFSKYLDQKLTKSGLSIKDEEQIVADIERGLQLFKFFTAKDIFETFFTQRLTKRILLDLSYSYDLEYGVFKKLKLECGDQYIRKAEDIMKDVFNQKQITDEFMKFAGDQGVTIPMQLQVTVISQNAWTLNAVKMPPSMSPFGEIQSLFEKYYSMKNDKMKLEWQLECSNCYVEATFRQDERYRFQVSVVQAMILLLFNENQKYSLQEICDRLHEVGTDEIVKSLIAFCTMKEQETLLKKNTEAKSVKKDDIFSVNDQFRNKKKMIRINQLQKRETKELIKETTSKVLHERLFMIDASIVKIMKRQRQSTLENLVKEVLDDLKLPLQAKDIKQQIEYLINKEYLERDSEEMNLFHYLA